MQRLAIAFAILIFSAISLKWFPFPFIWIFGGVMITSFLLIRFEKKSIAVFLFNTGSVFLILFVLELGLELVDPFEIKEPQGIRSNQLYDSIDHPDLGRVLRPNTKRRVWKSFKENMLYDVDYTVDQNGLRVSPPCLRECNKSILFFGCSFMFGEGVNDAETLPYQVGLRSHNQYQIYNFAVHGYGPQHMFALIENGMVNTVVKETPNLAIYFALYPEHIYRVSGLRSWIRKGPRYVLDSQGNAVRKGKFNDNDLDGPFWRFIRRQIRKSSLCNNILSYTRTIEPVDDELFAAVVLNSKRLLKKMYPGIEFHVLMWTDDPEIEVPIMLLSRLESDEITLHHLESVLEDNNITDSAAWIEADGHPTALSHEIFADYVVRGILNVDERQD